MQHLAVLLHPDVERRPFAAVGREAAHVARVVVADGRVELEATGDEGEVRAFLDQVAQSELHSLIREQTENKLNVPVAARGFEIRHD